MIIFTTQAPMNTLRHVRRLLHQFIRIDWKTDRALDTLAANVEGQNLLRHRPYSEIPGPKPIPLLGNNWRFLPYIGITKGIFRKRSTRLIISPLNSSVSPKKNRFRRKHKKQHKMYTFY